MEFLLLLLLVGLAITYSLVRQLKRRLERVEQELGWLREERHPAPQADRAALLERAARARAQPDPVADPTEAPAAPPTGMEQRPAEPEPQASEQEPAQPEPEGLGGMFERFVGGRLLIWVGGVALAVAGLLLVRYSIELGLVTPPVRMAMAAAFGLLLVAAGEGARWRPGLSPDPRIAQALVGAGILVLYAAAYGALVLYGLIGLRTCFVLMALITLAALLLSLRHGAPTAVMGLVGGFLTPLLVGEPGNSVVPLLAYLALLDLALFALAQRRGWTWLAAAAALLSFLWTGGHIFAPRIEDALATGAFVVALALAASLVRPGAGRQLRMIQPGAIGLAQLALLVLRTDIGLPAWALFALMSLACLALAAIRSEYRLLPPIAFALALLLLLVTGLAGTDPALPYVAGATTLMFGGFAWWRFEPRLGASLLASAAMTAPVLALRAGEPHLLAPAAWGGLLLGAALGPALLAWRQRAHATADSVDLPLLAGGAGAALLLVCAGLDLAPDERLGAFWTAAALAVALGGRRLDDKGIARLAAAVAALGFVAAVGSVPRLWLVLAESWFGMPALTTELPAPLDAVLAAGLPAAMLAAAAWILPARERNPRAGLALAAALLAASLAYVLFKQIFAVAGAQAFAERGFAERMVLTQILFAAGWLLGSGRVRLRALAGLQPAIAASLTAVAAARLIWFDLLLHNPALTAQHVGAIPLLNLLLPGCFGSAWWLYAARGRAVRRGARGTWLALFLLALVAGTLLLVRQAFQGSLLHLPGMGRGEFYAYSVAALALSIALLMAGVRLPDKAVRVAGLALLAATTIKVFLVDADELEGVLRILSFLGLGVALIGIGKLYGTLLRAERPARG